jgi:hypothetical protein
MTDDERKQEATDEEIEDLDAPEADAQQIKGGALQSYLNFKGTKQGKIEPSTGQTGPAPN